MHVQGEKYDGWVCFLWCFWDQLWEEIMCDGRLANTENYHFCPGSIDIIARFEFRSLFCSLKLVMGFSFIVHDCRCVPAHPRFLWILCLLLLTGLCLQGTELNGWNGTCGTTPCSGRSTRNSMILQALAIWYFIDYKHKLAATARSVLLYMWVHCINPKNLCFWRLKGKCTVLFTIVKNPNNQKTH